MSLKSLKITPHYRFPWRQQVQFELLVDGDLFFEQMLAGIKNAKTFIYLEMYLFESGTMATQFIDALTEASHNQVATYLLLDHYGCLGLEEYDRERLRQAGVQLSFYNPLHYGRWRRNLFRDHRKLLLIDGITAFTGGAGITDDFDKKSQPKHYWHEAMVKVNGECAQDWKELFEESWARWSDEIHQPMQEIAVLTGPLQTGRVVESRSITHSEIIRSFVYRVGHATQKAWLATAYFVPSRKLQRALSRKARDGVDVRLLLPGPHSDHPWARHMGRHYYHRLLSSGVRIFEYQPRFLHLKVLLCDDWVSIGSSNVDRWNFRWNLEANQEIDDAGFAAITTKQFRDDFANCLEITLENWKKRSWLTRLRMWYWGKVAALLSWLSFNK